MELIKNEELESADQPSVDLKTELLMLMAKKEIALTPEAVESFQEAVKRIAEVYNTFASKRKVASTKLGYAFQALKDFANFMSDLYENGEDFVDIPEPPTLDEEDKKVHEETEEGQYRTYVIIPSKLKDRAYMHEWFRTVLTKEVYDLAEGKLNATFNVEGRPLEDDGIELVFMSEAEGREPYIFAEGIRAGDKVYLQDVVDGLNYVPAE